MSEKFKIASMKKVESVTTLPKEEDAKSEVLEVSPVEQMESISTAPEKSKPTTIETPEESAMIDQIKVPDSTGPGAMPIPSGDSRISKLEEPQKTEEADVSFAEQLQESVAEDLGHKAEPKDIPVPESTPEIKEDLNVIAEPETPKAPITDTLETKVLDTPQPEAKLRPSEEDQYEIFHTSQDSLNKSIEDASQQFTNKDAVRAEDVHKLLPKNENLIPPEQNDKPILFPNAIVRLDGEAGWLLKGFDGDTGQAILEKDGKVVNENRDRLYLQNGLGKPPAHVDNVRVSKPKPITEDSKYDFLDRRQIVPKITKKQADAFVAPQPQDQIGNLNQVRNWNEKSILDRQPIQPEEVLQEEEVEEDPLGRSTPLTERNLVQPLPKPDIKEVSRFRKFAEASSDYATIVTDFLRKSETINNFVSKKELAWNGFWETNYKSRVNKLDGIIGSYNAKIAKKQKKLTEYRAKLASNPALQIKIDRLKREIAGFEDHKKDISEKKGSIEELRDKHVQRINEIAEDNIERFNIKFEIVNANIELLKDKREALIKTIAVLEGLKDNLSGYRVIKKLDYTIKINKLKRTLHHVEIKLEPIELRAADLQATMNYYESRKVAPS